MTSATEELRRLLDERGVEWTDFRDQRCVTAWLEPAGAVRADEYDAGLLLVERVMTPEQAVAATLGPGTCRMQRFESGTNMTRYGWSCSECGMRAIGFGAPSYCPTCGRRVKHE